MISAREQQDLLAFASSNPMQGLPVTGGERLSADWDAGRMYDASVAAASARREFVQPYLDRFEDATGQAWSTLQATDPYERQGYYGPVRQVLEQYRREHPESDLTFPTDDEIDAGGIQISQAALRRQGDIAARPNADSFGNKVAGFVGGTAAAMTDPVNLVTLPIGGGSSIPARIGIQAAVNAGSQAAIEAATTEYRRSVAGDDAVTTSSILTNIAEAAVGGAIFQGVGEGVGAGVKALVNLRKTPAGADAANVLERGAEMGASNPFPPGASGEIAHTEALGQAMDQIQAGQPVDVGETVTRAKARDQALDIDVGREGEPLSIRNLDYRHPETGEGILDALERSRQLAEEPTAGIATPERQQLRAQIADDLYGTGAAKKERIVDIVLGPPAAGKSSVAEPLAAERGALIIDSDMAKERLPEFEGGVGAAKVHEESAAIVEGDVLDRALTAGDNIVLPIVGKTAEKVHGLVDMLRSEGYDVRLHLVDLPTPKTVQRAASRFAETGRLVDPEYVAGVGDLPRQTFDAILSSGKVGAYAHYSTDVPRGSSPSVLREAGQASVLRPVRDGTGPRAGDAEASAAGPRGRFEEAGGRVDPADAERVLESQTDLTAKALDAETERLLADQDIDVPDIAVDENGNLVTTRRSARDLLKEADDEIAAAAEVEGCATGTAASTGGEA